MTEIVIDLQRLQALMDQGLSILQIGRTLGVSSPTVRNAIAKHNIRRSYEIDRGMIGALHRAGWSPEEIAEEMGLNAGTVDRILEELADG